MIIRHGVAEGGEDDRGDFMDAEDVLSDTGKAG
jgi:hypothetical protein